jgi:CDP-2,3-bis-(O-geranylgeranyl)-sn-glycerol synthase
MFVSALYYRYWSCSAINSNFILVSLLSAVWIMLPAYLPNSVAALFGGGTPIDRGKNFRDGRRIFGDGKTFRGLFVGIFAGIGIGVIQILVSGAYGLAILPVHTLLSVSLLAIGALLGDLCKSFFKRRLGKGRGAKWPVADQYDFVAGALLLTLLFDSAWIVENVTLTILIMILILSPLLHRAVNIIGYYMGVKEVPW